MDLVIQRLLVKIDNTEKVIRVANLSHYEVTIIEVGFVDKKFRPIPTARRPTVPVSVSPRGNKDFDISVADQIKIVHGSHTKSYVKLAGGKMIYSTTIDSGKYRIPLRGGKIQ